MTKQKHQKPLTFRQIATDVIMLGFAASVASTAFDYFIIKNTLYESARYGIATGVSVAGYTAIMLFLSPEEEYIMAEQKQIINACTTPELTQLCLQST